MNLIIRADASREIGTGHVMRSLALAQAWQAIGGRVRFLSRCESDALQALLREKGFGIIEIDGPHPGKSDLATILQVIEEISSGAETGSPWVALDGYHFDPSFQKAVRDAGARLLVVDDYNPHSMYHTDILLYRIITAVGTKYALLREEFLQRKGKSSPPLETVKKVLVTLGGSDPDNSALKVVSALKQVDIRGLEVKVVMGAANPHFREIQEEIERGCPTGTFRTVSNGDMPELMDWADVAVSAAGITCWELAFMGVPFLAFTLAENQRNIGPRLQHAGAAIDLGWPEHVEVAWLSKKIEDLLADGDVRRKMSSIARGLVDGQGAKRVVSIMEWLSEGKDAAGLSIREALPEDCGQVWLLSNNRGVRENSFNSEPISFENHILWYKEKLVSPDVAFYVSDLHGVVGGQVRYDRKNDAAEISFSVAPAFRGRGLGKALIKDTIGQACNKLMVDRVFGLVKGFNHASIRAFLALGFQRIRDQEVNNCKCILFEVRRSPDHTRVR
jgi:UDP-2,4-diacetamido-2,4,6-trideoxy-beta-L-altropyranose hydrolase